MRVCCVNSNCYYNVYFEKCHFMGGLLNTKLILFIGFDEEILGGRLKLVHVVTMLISLCLWNIYVCLNIWKRNIINNAQSKKYCDI